MTVRNTRPHRMVDGACVLCGMRAAWAGAADGCAAIARTAAEGRPGRVERRAKADAIYAATERKKRKRIRRAMLETAARWAS